jgi:signal transduction histidine kinase
MRNCGDGLGPDVYLRCTYRVPRIDLRPASRPVDPPAASGSCRLEAASAVLAPHRVLGPGYPCGDDAALLVSELFGNSVRHSGSGAKGETVTVAVRAADGVVRVEVTDRGGRGMPQLRPCGSEAESAGG